MTDQTALDMLTAARALHERSDHTPGDCGTCSTGDRYVAWPCDTAKALGATGRSEWTTPAPAGPCGAIRTEPDGNFSGWAGFQDYPCSLTAGHATRHQDRDGDQW